MFDMLCVYFGFVISMLLVVFRWLIRLCIVVGVGYLVLGLNSGNVLRRLKCVMCMLCGVMSVVVLRSVVLYDCVCRLLYSVMMLSGWLMLVWGLMVIVGCFDWWGELVCCVGLVDYCIGVCVVLFILVVCVNFLMF